MDAAEQLAAAANVAKLLPCDPSKSDASQCARQFISTFGKRAYRRPLDAAEVDSLFATFEEGSATFGSGELTDIATLEPTDIATLEPTDIATLRH
ncbi:DUF1595 domain-containing protein [Labilithrix luteola]|uniref:DUF1595 domain-containing protein n=1 Tax=Labilithrix luteola TaxID=1391654 RepID=UPI0011BA4A1D|nr:DUF1595 domain-containing protein [Labilithrix luteola]